MGTMPALDTYLPTDTVVKVVVAADTVWYYTGRRNSHVVVSDPPRGRMR